MKFQSKPADYRRLKIYNKENNIVNAPLITCNNSYHISFHQDYVNKNKILNSGLYVSFCRRLFLPIWPAIVNLRLQSIREARVAVGQTLA